MHFTSDGGETHTFTRVANYGGDFVERCRGQRSDQEVLAGGTLLPPGEHEFQCCIHPWMRTKITVR